MQFLHVHMHFPKGTTPEHEASAVRVKYSDVRMDIEDCINDETKGLPKKIAIVGKDRSFVKAALADMESVCFWRCATPDKDSSPQIWSTRPSSVRARFSASNECAGPVKNSSLLIVGIQWCKRFNSMDTTDQSMQYVDSFTRKTQGRSMQSKISHEI
jgi:hypothetical protein